MTTCECGCGEFPKLGNRFVHHHYSRTKEHKINVSKRHKGKVISKETKQKMSTVAKGRDMSIQIKKAADLHRGTKYAVEIRKKMSDSQKLLWANPKHYRVQQSKMAQGSRLQRPNKKEVKLLNLLDSLYPGDWKYVGDGALIINGKNPDFVNVNGKKLIVELFGDYWHRNDSPRKRMGVFRPYGFRTLVVWERELNNCSLLASKINRFVNR